MDCNAPPPQPQPECPEPIPAYCGSKLPPKKAVDTTWGTEEDQKCDLSPLKQPEAVFCITASKVPEITDCSCGDSRNLKCKDHGGHRQQQDHKHGHQGHHEGHGYHGQFDDEREQRHGHYHGRDVRDEHGGQCGCGDEHRHHHGQCDDERGGRHEGGYHGHHEQAGHCVCGDERGHHHHHGHGDQECGHHDHKHGHHEHGGHPDQHKHLETKVKCCIVQKELSPKVPRRKKAVRGKHDHFSGKSKTELKSKLEECIRKFDEGAPDTLQSLETLRGFLTDKLFDEDCHPKKEWPHCPTHQGPEAFEVPHPYIPGKTLYTKPRFNRSSIKVTVDGRPAEFGRPKRYFHEEPPLNVPPWVLPRYKSQELRGGLLLKGCHCWKKNGLQDDCPRWDCAGRPECRIRPLPVCPPSMNPPICGVRKPNLYDGKPPSSAKIKPPPPYPMEEPGSIAAKVVPNSSSCPCPLHEESTCK